MKTLYDYYLDLFGIRKQLIDIDKHQDVADGKHSDDDKNND